MSGVLWLTCVLPFCWITQNAIHFLEWASCHRCYCFFTNKHDVLNFVTVRCISCDPVHNVTEEADPGCCCCFWMKVSGWQLCAECRFSTVASKQDFSVVTSSCALKTRHCLFVRMWMWWVTHPLSDWWLSWPHPIRTRAGDKQQQQWRRMRSPSTYVSVYGY